MRLEGDPLQVQGAPSGLLELGHPWAKAFGLLSVVYRRFPMVKRRLGLLLAGLWLYRRGLQKRSGRRARRRGLRGLRAGRGRGWPRLPWLPRLPRLKARYGR